MNKNYKQLTQSGIEIRVASQSGGFSRIYGTNEDGLVNIVEFRNNKENAKLSAARLKNTRNNTHKDLAMLELLMKFKFPHQEEWEREELIKLNETPF
jgi:hypothetical protein